MPIRPIHLVLRLALSACLLAASTANAAQTRPKEPDDLPRPAQIQQLFDCRAITDTTQRLACYDREVGRLQTADANRDIMIADRKTVKKARRSLFGFTLPKIALFGGKNGENDVRKIETTVKSASITKSGKYRITMENDALWTQIDSTPLRRDPKPADKVEIKTAALGTYFVKINGQRSIRMRRIR